MTRMILLLLCVALGSDTMAQTPDPLAPHPDAIVQLSQDCTKISSIVRSLGCQAQADTLRSRVDAKQYMKEDAAEIDKYRDGEVVRIRDEYGLPRT